MLTQIWSAHTDIIFCHFRPFFVLLPNCWPRKLKFQKKHVKKHLEILSFYTCAPLIKIIAPLIWCMAPEIWSSTDRVILNYFENIKNGKKKALEMSSFYKSLPKIMIICYTVREMSRETDVIVYFSFVQFFSPFTPYSPKTENVKKMK